MHDFVLASVEARRQSTPKPHSRLPLGSDGDKGGLKCIPGVDCFDNSIGLHDSARKAGRADLREMSNMSKNKQRKLLARRRANETGESLSIAKLQLDRQRVEVSTVGYSLVGEGTMVPRREIRTHRGASTEQLAKAIFGPNWRPPKERCPKCHTWVSHDGFCHCNGDQRPMAITQVVTVAPADTLDHESSSELDPELQIVRAALEDWMRLPPAPIAIEPECCHLAATVGCLRCPTEAADATGLYSLEPFGPEFLYLGDIKLEIEGGGWQRHRLPATLGRWAWEQVQDANRGLKRFPAFFALQQTDTTFEVFCSPLRADDGGTP